MLLCIVYAMLFVDTVDMNIKACNALNAIFVDTGVLHNTVYRVMRCENCIDSVNIDSIEYIRDPCLVSTVLTYIVLMVWLKSPQSQLSKTFCGLKIG